MQTSTNLSEKVGDNIGTINLSLDLFGTIPLKEIDVNTMESKLVKDLYITGELLDCDGDCGGYNLTWAWITGIIAGEEI